MVQFVRAVRNHTTDGKNSQPLGQVHQTTDGTQVVNSFHVRPVGGYLALAWSSLWLCVMHCWIRYWKSLLQPSPTRATHGG